MSFKKCETFTVSEIKPKVLSEIVNKTVKLFCPEECEFSHMSVKQFLIEFVKENRVEDEKFEICVNIMANLKEILLSAKFFKKRELYEKKVGTKI